MKQLLSLLLITLSTFTMHAQETSRQAYQQALKSNWKETFSDNCTGNWKDKWFLDGLKADVRNTPDGLYFSAGPIEGDDASHAVLWSKENFSGDIKLEFDFTRMDTINRWVCIVFLEATGTGEGPFAKDITQWSDLRRIPSMKSYYDNMNLLHISFTAYGNKTDPVDNSYIRARRYPSSLYSDGFKGMELTPDFQNTGLFHPGNLCHVTIIKKGNDLFMNVVEGKKDNIFHWDLTQKPLISEGRIGFRHMAMRAGIYKNITVSQPASR